MKLIDADTLKEDLTRFYDGEVCARDLIDEQPTIKPQQWIPCSERLPENTDPVNITWVNRNPPVYYASIKDVPYVATGCYCKGKWWWYSAVCQDYLDEYGESYNVDAVDEDIEIIAWMPLPEPYQEVEHETD